MANILPFKPGPGRAPVQPDQNATDALLPCPFCGEVESLGLGEEETHLAVDADGKPILIEVTDTVFCGVCDASAPLETWNSRVSPKGAA